LTSEREDRQLAEQIDRWLGVLQALMGSPNREWGVRELAGKLDITPSTTQRILASLESRGFARRSDNERYVPGPNLYALSSRLLSQSDVLILAQEAMRELVDDLNETAHLALYDPNSQQAVFSSSVQCAYPVRYVIEPGMRTPLNAGATGKAMLAYLPESVVADLVLPKFTESTVTDRAALMRELAQIRHSGYAVSSGERIEGASGIASAVLSREGVVGALTISVPTYRFDTKRIPEFGAKLSRAAASVSMRLGSPTLMSDVVP
jgi:IclR family acetate operon transcriptional repressor